MSLTRVQVIHKHLSGLPRDSFVNTWHVRTPTVGDAQLADIAEAIGAFYTITRPSPGGSMMGMFGDQVATTGHELRVYVIDEATGVQTAGEGAPPQHQSFFDHLGRVAGGNTGAPSEVAICLSMRNETTQGVPLRRKRGRVYIGPINVGMVVEAADFQRPSINAGTRAAIVANAGFIVSDLAAIGSELVIYSRPFEGRPAVERTGRPDLPAIAARPGTAYAVDRFWVDDAFDIQRRRGERAVARTVGPLV